jgi:acetoin utilization protein AcuC
MTAKRLAPVLVSHDIYRHATYRSSHPLAIPRVEAAVDLCRALGWLPEGELRISPQASEQQLLRFHTREYVGALRQAARSGKVTAEVRRRFAIGTMENPLFPGVFERAATSVGGSIRAAELACDGRIAFHPAGGTHHGRPDRASGFCYLNDPVFAVLTLLDNGVGRVLYLDLDAHHGDAVQDAFADDPRVWTVSLHERGRWPHTGDATDTGAGQACNLAVPPGLNDSELKLLLDNIMLRLGNAVEPRAVVVVCGADALAGDPLSSMALSNVALWSAVRRLADLAPAAVVLGGGGYNPWTLARYWAGLWGVLSGRPLPAALPDAARDMLAQLSCDLIDGEDVQEQWLSALADRGNEGPVRPAVEALRDLALRHADPAKWSGAGSPGIARRQPGAGERDARWIAAG